MTRYESLPLSLADATLIAIAERENRANLFTFDQRLRAVQLVEERHLNIIPWPNSDHAQLRDI